MSEPGWYPDPDDSSQARYWDGSSWTDRTQARDEPESREPPPADTAGGSSSPSLLRRPVAWVAVVVVLALVAGLLFVVLGSDSASAGEVILEPSAADGDDPFFESVATSAVEVEGGGVEEVAGGGDSIESVGGATPGLYGGTGDDAVCDPAGLVGFLDENSEKAAAFADVLGIAPADIEDYVAGLTPVLLREDTRVTNHGFESGRATARQSVFQAGTAVLVDDRGVPRVRCACGNPLTEPDAASGSYEGDPWRGFDDSRLVAVAPAGESQSELELVNVTTGEPYTVPVGGSAGGMTVEELLNVTVPWSVCGEGLPPAQLVNGVYGPIPDPRAPVAMITLRILGAGDDPTFDEPRAFVGDVTDDGADDGLILVVENCGGSGSFFGALVYSGGDILAMLPVDEAAQAITGSDGSAQFTSGGIDDDGTIELEGLQYAPDDPNCCPSLPVTVRFRWNGSQFVPADDSGGPSSGAQASCDEQTLRTAVEAIVADDPDLRAAPYSLEFEGCSQGFAKVAFIDPSGVIGQGLNFILSGVDGTWQLVNDDYYGLVCSEEAAGYGIPPDVWAELGGDPASC